MCNWKYNLRKIPEKRGYFDGSKHYSILQSRRVAKCILVVRVLWDVDCKNMVVVAAAPHVRYCKTVYYYLIDSWQHNTEIHGKKKFIQFYLPPPWNKATSERRPPRYRGLTITFRHTAFGRTPFDAWHLYLTPHNTHKRHPCQRRDSNAQSQQASGRRPTP